MAVIHHTTLKPTKLELLTSWLPHRPWYVGGAGRTPELEKAGGFRLDDPEGEVGIEFMVVTDTSGDRPVSYHVPLTYRAAPIDGATDAEHGLVGTTEHGVLGLRYVYDGTHDPVFVAQLLALLQGHAEPQAQSDTDTPDPTVVPSFSRHAATGVTEPVTATGPSPVTDGPQGTDVLVRPAAESGRAADAPSAPLVLRVARVLRAAEPSSGTAPDERTLGHVTAGWRLPDGEERRGHFVVVAEGS
ncbi:1,4-alpha-glucan branching protein [Streptomyces sp. NPDC053755]|uniref:maltokinase N-terminal cap-like domain-containing protein n=1 Tax=Streptomyces sp. NPDC053755 TaxID=3155815 RepID=UPI00343B566A